MKNMNSPRLSTPQVVSSSRERQIGQTRVRRLRLLSVVCPTLDKPITSFLSSYIILQPQQSSKFFIRHLFLGFSLTLLSYQKQTKSLQRENVKTFWMLDISNRRDVCRKVILGTNIHKCPPALPESKLQRVIVDVSRAIFSAGSIQHFLHFW